MKRAGSDSADSWMISSNPFDVIGSVSAGMRAAWIKRSPEAIFDPWGIEPTVTVNSLSALAGQIKTYCNDNSG
jgi:2-haloacid dehalogenase